MIRFRQYPFFFYLFGKAEFVLNSAQERAVILFFLPKGFIIAEGPQITIKAPNRAHLFYVFIRWSKYPDPAFFGSWQTVPSNSLSCAMPSLLVTSMYKPRPAGNRHATSLVPQPEPYCTKLC